MPASPLKGLAGFVIGIVARGQANGTSPARLDHKQSRLDPLDRRTKRSQVGTIPVRIRRSQGIRRGRRRLWKKTRRPAEGFVDARRRPVARSVGKGPPVAPEAGDERRRRRRVVERRRRTCAVNDRRRTCAEWPTNVDVDKTTLTRRGSSETLRRRAGRDRDQGGDREQVSHRSPLSCVGQLDQVEALDLVELRSVINLRSY
jgi:hypothetical protein